MRKVLLMGELNRIAQNLNESLMGDFHVQICAYQLAVIKQMISFVNPDLLIIVQAEVSQESVNIVDYLDTEHSELPIIILCSNEEQRKVERLYGQLKDYEILYRPIQKTNLIEACYRHLSKEEDDDTGTPDLIGSTGIPGLEDISSFLGNMISSNDSIFAEPEKQKATVMVVDDDHFVLRNMKKLLEGKYIVELATSGEQALKLIPKKRPDVVLLDYEMPGMNGRDTFKFMKEHEEMKHIPVIFLTGVAEKENIVAVLQLNPQGYILKPPSEVRLLVQIEEAIRSK